MNKTYRLERHRVRERLVVVKLISKQMWLYLENSMLHWLDHIGVYSFSHVNKDRKLGCLNWNDRSMMTRHPAPSNRYW